MFREDGAKLQVKFYEVGLMPHLSELQLAQYHKEPLMAFRAEIWGLGLWYSGREYLILDEKGFLTKTPDGSLALRLISFESVHGPGALRAVLKREILNPQGAVQVLKTKFNPSAPVPAAKPEPIPKPLRRRKIDPAEFSKLLEGL